MSLRRNGSGGNRRGMTLLEVMVAAVVAVAVVGMALGILIAVNKTARNAIDRGSQLQQAQLAMREIRSILAGAVWPEDVGTTLAAQATHAFGRDAMQVLSTHRPGESGAFCRYVFLARGGDVGSPARPGFRRLQLDRRDDPGRFRPLGGNYETTVEFRYATEIGAEGKPVWKESLPDGEKPRLVWVRVTLRDPDRKDRKGEPEEVRMETAVAL